MCTPLLGREIIDSPENSLQNLFLKIYFLSKPQTENQNKSVLHYWALTTRPLQHRVASWAMCHSFTCVSAGVFTWLMSSSNSWRGLCSISVTPFCLPTKRYWQCHRKLWLLDVGLRGLINMPIFCALYYLFCGVNVDTVPKGFIRSRSAEQVMGESWLWRTLSEDANSRKRQETKWVLIWENESWSMLCFLEAAYISLWF